MVKPFRSDQAHRLEHVLRDSGIPIRTGTAVAIHGAIEIGVGAKAFVRIDMFGDVSAYDLSGTPNARNTLKIAKVNRTRDWMRTLHEVLFENLDAIERHVGAAGDLNALCAPEAAPGAATTDSEEWTPYGQGWLPAIHPDVPEGYRVNVHTGEFAAYHRGSWGLAKVDPRRREAMLRWKKGRKQGRTVAAEVILHTAGIPRPARDARLFYLDGNVLNPCLSNVMWVYAANALKIKSTRDFSEQVQMLHTLGYQQREIGELLGASEGKVYNALGRLSKKVE